MKGRYFFVQFWMKLRRFGYKEKFMKHLLGIRFLGATRDEARKNFVDLMVESLRMLPYYISGQIPEPTPSMRKGRPRQLVTIFGEQSTRTKNSFEAAARKLGMDIGSPVTSDGSSLGKGETLPNTARMLIQYGATHLVPRFKIEGIGVHLAKVLEDTATPESWVSRNFSILVGGAGTQNHPSQVALDCLTLIALHFGIRTSEDALRIIPDLFSQGEDRLRADIETYLDSLKISFVGDLIHSRVVHDWVDLGRWFDITFQFVSPKIFRLQNWALSSVSKFSQSEQLSDAFSADVVYMIRMQIERFDETVPAHEAQMTVQSFQVNRRVMDKYGRDDLILMDAQPVDSNHPMIHPELWNELRNVMFMQSAMGVPGRMGGIRLCDMGQYEDCQLLEVPRYRYAKSDILRAETLDQHWKTMQAKYGRQQLFAGQVRNGCVIDRLPSGCVEAIHELNKRAGIYKGHPFLRGSDFPSETMGTKDVLFLHGIQPPRWLTGAYAIVAPTVRLSLMDEGRENGYRRVAPSLPKVVKGVFSCPNSNCVTNVDPEAKTFFHIHGEKGDVDMQCGYCQHHFPSAAVVSLL